MPEIDNYDLLVVQNPDGSARIEKYLVDEVGVHLEDVIPLSADDFAFLESIVPEGDDA